MSAKSRVFRILQKFQSPKKILILDSHFGGKMRALLLEECIITFSSNMFLLSSRVNLLNDEKSTCTTLHITVLKNDSKSLILRFQPHYPTSYPTFHSNSKSNHETFLKDFDPLCFKSEAEWLFTHFVINELRWKTNKM